MPPERLSGCNERPLPGMGVTPTEPYLRCGPGAMGDAGRFMWLLSPAAAACSPYHEPSQTSQCSCMFAIFSVAACIMCGSNRCVSSDERDRTHTRTHRVERSLPSLGVSADQRLNAHKHTHTHMQNEHPSGKKLKNGRQGERERRQVLAYAVGGRMVRL